METNSQPSTAVLVALGTIAVTSGVVGFCRDLLNESGGLEALLKRHESGDFGEVTPAQIKANHMAIESGEGRVLGLHSFHPSSLDMDRSIEDLDPNTAAPDTLDSLPPARVYIITEDGATAVYFDDGEVNADMGRFNEVCEAESLDDLSLILTAAEGFARSH